MLKVNNRKALDYTNGNYYEGSLRTSARLLTGVFFVKNSTFYFTGLEPFSADQVNYELWVEKCVN